MNNHIYAIILAGGKGTRLWPISRRNRPKHVIQLPLNGERTMLQRTIERVLKGFDSDRIYISTTKAHAVGIRKQLPSVANDHLCTEETPKGTGVAVGLAVRTILRRDPGAIIVSINSDAHVTKERQYLNSIHRAARVVRAFPQQIVLVGVPPLYPDTGLGYIMVDKKIRSKDVRLGEIFHVRRFVEKPTLAKATAMISSKKCFWNPTLIVASAQHLWDAYRKHAVGSANIMEQIVPTSGVLPTTTAVKKLFASLPPLSIEYHILEKERNLLMISAGEIGWADIGQWATVLDVLSRERKTHVVSIGQHADYHSNHSLIYNTTSALVATVKLSNIILIVTNDVILALDKHYAQEVKTLVTLLEGRKWEQYT